MGRDLREPYATENGAVAIDVPLTWADLFAIREGLERLRPHCANPPHQDHVLARINEAFEKVNDAT